MRPSSSSASCRKMKAKLPSEAHQSRIVAGNLSAFELARMVKLRPS
jgi:hypothetical protein